MSISLRSGNGGKIFGRLDALRQRELRPDALLLRCDRLDILDIFVHALRHGSEGFRQLLRFVACREIPGEVQRIAFDCFHLLRQDLDRMHDIPGKADGDPDRHRDGDAEQAEQHPRGVLDLVAAVLHGLGCLGFEIRKQLFRRRFDFLLRQHDEQGPADGLHGRKGDVAGHSVDVDQVDALESDRRVRSDLRQRPVFRFAEIRPICHSRQAAFLRCGEQDLSVPVHDAGESVRTDVDAFDQFFHVLEVHARAGDSYHFAVLEDGCAAHDPQARRVRVLRDRREIRALQDRRAAVPGTLFRFQGHQVAVFVILFRRNVICLHHKSGLRGHVDRDHDVLVRVDRHQRVLHVAEQAQFSFDLRVLRVRLRGIQHLHRQLPFSRRVGKRYRPGGIVLRVIVDLFRRVRGFFDAVFEFREDAVRDRGLFDGHVLHQTHRFFRHVIRGEPSDRPVQFPVGFRLHPVDAVHRKNKDQHGQQQHDADDREHRVQDLFSQRLILDHFIFEHDCSPIVADYSEKWISNILLYNAHF